MKKIIFSIVAVFLLISGSIKAQTKEEITIEPIMLPADQISLGLGMGFDYGGFGGNLLFYPQQNIGLFAGVGYAIAGTGFNAGIKARLLNKKGNQKLRPYLMAMYGYNAAIAVSGAEQYNKLFYNFSFAVGFDYCRNPTLKKNFWSFALTIPVRGEEVQEYMDDLKDNHGVEFKNSLPPVGVSIGYHIVFK